MGIWCYVIRNSVFSFVSIDKTLRIEINHAVCTLICGLIVTQFRGVGLFPCIVSKSSQLPVYLRWHEKVFKGQYLPWTNALCPLSKSQRLPKEGILDIARESAHFQQHGWGYFAFKRSPRCRLQNSRFFSQNQ